MKSKTAFMIFQLIVFAAAALLQPLTSNAQSTSSDANALAGVWRGQGEAQQAGLSFATLTLANEGGNLSGALLLWVVRLDQGKPVASDPGVPEPILNPSFDGHTLTFQVKYRGPLPRGVSSDNPLLRFRLKLMAPSKAELERADLVADAESITGSPQPLGAPVPMVRTEN
jgi:hypothetical protein